MQKLKFNISDKVALARHVVARTGHNKTDADARGRVVAVEGAVVAVDFAGTWIPRADGGTVRCLPAANLTKIMANGVVYEY
tara:strand:- start:642 stop:884 length:243 start_codon:yes stop_codon:yes gene_type:complete